MMTPGSRYVQLMQGMPNVNNGTTLGGLGHVLQQAMMGYGMRKEREEEEASSGVLSQALREMMGTPGNTITWNQRPDGVTPEPTVIDPKPGNLTAALQLLGSNPRTAPMALQIGLEQALRQSEISDPWANIDMPEGYFPNDPDNPAAGVSLLGGYTPDQPAPKTITTAEGVFVLNPDGSLGQRLGSPTSQGSTSVEVYTGPTGPQVGTIPQGYSLQQLEDGSYVMAPIPGGPEDQPLLTPAQQAIDQAFAAEYASSFASGGLADAQKNLEQLRGVQSQLNDIASGQSDANLTGFWAGNLPDEVLAMTNPAALAARDQVEEVVQRNLRLILGPQFTEEEGKRLIARAYNPRLDEPENAARIGRLMAAMESALNAKVAAARYYEQHGTLQGFEGTAQFTMQYFNDVLGNDSGGSGEPALGGGGWSIQQVQ